MYENMLVSRFLEALDAEPEDEPVPDPKGDAVDDSFAAHVARREREQGGE